MSTYKLLEDHFREDYSLRQLKTVSALQFQQELANRIGKVDSAQEGYLEEGLQRDLSVKFHWGHNHDFGDGFVLPGRMQNRHLEVIADFIDDFGLTVDLHGLRILDIGVWTGGTSLLLVSLGAEVVALEEVTKYAECLNYLAVSFGIHHQLRCLPRSLYDFLPQIADCFDIVLFAGVAYHVTDPLLSLRLIFSALKDGGRLFVETFGIQGPDSLCRYEGPSITHSGTLAARDRSGWNYFIPSPSCLKAWCQDAGFQEVVVGDCLHSRIKGRATRAAFQEICRAGLSNPRCR